MATVLHVALLSLHLTSSFERGLQAAVTETANLGIHAFCGPNAPASLPGDLADSKADLPSNGDKSSKGCPICTGAALAAFVMAPQIALAPIVYSVSALPPMAEVARPLTRPQRFADTIRGPPATA